MSGLPPVRASTARRSELVSMVRGREKRERQGRRGKGGRESKGNGQDGKERKEGEGLISDSIIYPPKLCILISR